MIIKPMLAQNYDESKLRFPLIAQPKIDGVRGMNTNGVLTGRSLKQHKNKFTTERLSGPRFLGLDGELAAGDDPCNPALCRKTTSAMNTIEGQPVVLWWVFDYITEDTIGLPYVKRLRALRDFTCEGDKTQELRRVESVLIKNLAQLEDVDARWLRMGYEGTILRDPQGMYKQGRSTTSKGELLRIKRFEEEEAEVLGVIEGRSNQNEAKTNLLGHTERSSHAENMTPNGMVGSLKCRDLKTNTLITVSAGALTHEERLRYFMFPQSIIGQTIKYRTFKKGVKNLPRFPTFHSFRMASDL